MLDVPHSDESTAPIAPSAAAPAESAESPEDTGNAEVADPKVRLRTARRELRAYADGEAVSPDFHLLGTIGDYHDALHEVSERTDAGGVLQEVLPASEEDIRRGFVRAANDALSDVTAYLQTTSLEEATHPSIVITRLWQAIYFAKANGAGMQVSAMHAQIDRLNERVWHHYLDLLIADANRLIQERKVFEAETRITNVREMVQAAMLSGVTSARSRFAEWGELHRHLGSMISIEAPKLR